MCISFFKTGINTEISGNIVKDFIRLVRDVISIASHFLPFMFLGIAASYLNHFLGDKLSSDYNFNF